MTTSDESATMTAEQHKAKGNDLFKHGDYLNAIDEYMKAIELDSKVPAYFSNAAAAFAKIDEHERAIEMAHNAIELDPTFTKAYYRRAVSLMAMGEYKRAFKDLSLIMQATPGDVNVKAQMLQCEKLNMQKNFALALRVDQFDLDEAAISKLEIPDTYSGPRLGSFDRCSPSFVVELIEWFKLEHRLSVKVAYMILNIARKAFASQPSLVNIHIPEGGKIIVCGDIHGQFYDLVKIFEINGYPSDKHYYLFNGDFVDRGAYSIEVILTMFALKAAYPEYFFMARGNHESEHVNRLHGFMEETKRKYDDKMFSMMNKVFNALPLVHVIQNKLFVVHGGLPAKEDFVLADVASIDRFKDPPNGTMFSQLLWSDPKQTLGISPSHRGEGILWGPDITERFLERNDLSMIIRSHVWEPTGYKLDHNGKCVTIFSAPNYTGVNSPAAVMNIDSDLNIEYKQFDAADFQGKASKPRPPFAGFNRSLLYVALKGPFQGTGQMSGGATEWEDLLIQHGIMKAPVNPEDAAEEVVYKVTTDKGSDADSLDELDDDDFFDSYRNKRFTELNRPQQAGTFGDVIEISRPDFVTEVSEASKSHFIVLHLYQSGLASCQLLSKAMRALCFKHKSVKFVEIVSTRCIGKYPEALLPTILVYKDTNVYSQITQATPEKLKQTLEVIQEHLDNANRIHGGAMPELSEFVASTAVASLDAFKLGHTQYYILNKYSCFEIVRLDCDQLRLVSVLKKAATSGILQVKSLEIDDDSRSIYTLLSDGTVEQYLFASATLESGSSISLPATEGPAYLPSYLEVDTKLLVLAGYLGAMAALPLPIVPGALSARRDFKDVAVGLKIIRMESGPGILLITQSETLTDRYELSLFQLANGNFDLSSSVELSSDIQTPPLIVPLSGNILLLSETRAQLFGLSENGIQPKNAFNVQTQPPSSYIEAPTAFCCKSQVFKQSFDKETFFASTSKGEILRFDFYKGQFVITPINVVDTEKQERRFYSVLHYDVDHEVLLAIGETLDGALIKLSPLSPNGEVARALPNWAPITDLDSTTKKNGLVVASSGNPGVSGQLCQVRHGIRNSIVFQSDTQFRGATNVWPLKRFKADEFHSFIAVSFANSTCLFSISENELELISSCGLETGAPTVTIANLETSSFWLQVCPDRIVVVKICEPDMVRAPSPAVWRPESMYTSAAAIIRSNVVLLDAKNQRVVFLKISCTISTGSADITELGQIPLECTNCSTLTAFPIELGAETELLVAVSTDVSIQIFKAVIGAMFTWSPVINIPVSKPSDSLVFWTHSKRTYFGIGFRNGSASFYDWRDGDAALMFETQIGNAPTRLVVVKLDREEQSICCTSRGVWFFAHKADNGPRLEKFHPHVEAFAPIRMADFSKQRMFITLKKDTITIIKANLHPSSWLYRMFSGEDLTKAVLGHEGTSLVSALSSPSSGLGFNSLEMLHISEMDFLLRTKIPAHITSICRLSKPGYYAIASVDSGGLGAVHIYHATYQQEYGKQQRRRGSLAEIKKQPASFSFVSASSGFYSMVSAMCEVLDGLILLSCDSDLYLLKLKYEEPTLQFFRSEPRRSRTYHISSWRCSDQCAKVAIYDEDGIEVVLIDLTSDSIIKHVRGDTCGRMGGKSAWLNERYLLITEKTGSVSILDTEDSASMWISTAQRFDLLDIPYSICTNPEKENSVLVGTMLGAIYELTFADL